MPNTDWHRRHHDFHWVDRVEYTTVPRYKTSGLSGDEWRISVLARAWFKSCLVLERTYGNMVTALQMFPVALIEHGDLGASNEWSAEEKRTCDQPGCVQPAVIRYRLKEVFSPDGRRLHPDEHPHSTHYAKFCNKHKTRGDCGREDSDDNYTRLLKS